MTKSEWEWNYGSVMTGAYQSVLPSTTAQKTQPPGFKGANPGKSLDDRGLPRIRVKAIMEGIKG